MNSALLKSTFDCNGGNILDLVSAIFGTDFDAFTLQRIKAKKPWDGPLRLRAMDANGNTLPYHKDASLVRAAIVNFDPNSIQAIWYWVTPDVGLDSRLIEYWADQHTRLQVRGEQERQRCAAIATIQSLMLQHDITFDDLPKEDE